MYRRGFYLGPVATIILANILVFIITTIRPDLIYLLGLQPAGLVQRPWTIVTDMFVHADIGHILVNMLTLYFFGTFLTRMLGDRNFLIVYFVGGLVGNIFFFLLASPFTVAVGASGAIFAVGGALAVLRPKSPVIVFPLPVEIPLWVAVVGGFLIVSYTINVAWQAHLGGLLFGAAIAYFYYRKKYYFL